MNPISSINTNSLTMRGILVGMLVLVLMIPASMVGSIVSERQYRFASVEQEIGNAWGNQQHIGGPVLVLPFTETWTTQQSVLDAQGIARSVIKNHEREQLAVVLPRRLTAALELDPEARRRGIYETHVYTAIANLTAAFAPPNWERLTRRTIKEVHWTRAYLAMGVSVTRSIRELTATISNGPQSTPLEVQPGARLGTIFEHGVHLPLTNAKQWLSSTDNASDVTLTIHVVGSQALAVQPLAGEASVTMSSSWPHPSFFGLLPVQHNISDAGFTAQWNIPALAQGMPTQFLLGTENPGAVGSADAGVTLASPVTLYSKTERAVKYAILFIALTFALFLIFELVAKARAHFVQYALIGLALALFYLVLLALSEHIDFTMAYLVAASSIVLLIGMYAAAALGSWQRGAIVGGLEAGLFALLFVILHQEDYALLMGTAVLLAALASLMYFTRSLTTSAESGQ